MPPRFSFNTDLTSSVNAPLITVAVKYVLTSVGRLLKIHDLLILMLIIYQLVIDFFKNRKITYLRNIDHPKNQQERYRPGMELSNFNDLPQ
jgi:hypothetical protein